MKTCIIIIILQVTCVYRINGMAISKPETHKINKRSADHGISEANSRHRNALQRQLLLSKILRAIDTSSASPVLDNVDTPEPIINSEPSRKHRHSKASRSHKRRSSKAQRALEKSLGKIVRSKYGDEVLDAIAGVIPQGDRKARNTIQRIRKFAKSLGDRPCTIN